MFTYQLVRLTKSEQNCLNLLPISYSYIIIASYFELSSILYMFQLRAFMRTAFNINPGYTQNVNLYISPPPHSPLPTSQPT